MLSIYIVLVTAATGIAQQKEFPTLTGPYLGQKPPGMTPEIFVPGIISTGMSESSIAISPDGEEIFYTVHAGNSETIVTTRLENGHILK